MIVFEGVDTIEKYILYVLIKAAELMKSVTYLNLN